MGRIKKARYKSPVNEASSQIVCMYVQGITLAYIRTFIRSK